MDGVYTGQRMLVEVQFLLNGVPTDPTIVAILYRAPSGARASLAYPNADFVRRSDGLYEASILATEEGTWAFRVEGAGVVDAVNEMFQVVLASGLDG